ncbi:hypothetical protein HPMBJEAJ_00021 [Aeromonas phage avDM6]|nr:hypothetical protein HPMBJEAJ_00021 [Aeromonas phage avDM6]
MLEWFKKKDILRFYIDLSYIDGLGCKVFVHSAILSIEIDKSCDLNKVKELIDIKAKWFAQNNIVFQKTLNDKLVIPRRGFAQFSSDKVDLVNSNRKFWSYEAYDFFSAKTTWGIDLQNKINEAIRNG